MFRATFALGCHARVPYLGYFCAYKMFPEAVMTMLKRCLIAALMAASCVLSALGTLSARAQSQLPALQFGVISTGKVEDTRAAWEPFFVEMSRATGLNIQGSYPARYSEVVDALRANKVQVAWLSNKAALEAVEKANAEVFAQMVGADGAQGYRSLIITDKTGKVNSLEALLAKHSSLRFAMGEASSTSGYLIPMHSLFGPRNIVPEAYFAKFQVGKHADNLQALLAGDVDATIYNTEELDKLKAREPAVAARLHTLWESTLIPKDPLVWRRELPASVKTKIAEFALAYGKTPVEKQNLRLMFDLAGFKKSSNAQLRPMLEIEDFKEKLAVVLDNKLSEAQKTVRLAELRKRFYRVSAQLGAERTENK
jgi:phosphonate transport system substrate-binding protein